MKNLQKNLVRAVLASVVGGAALMVSDVASIISGNLVTTASAVIGRPATPLSYAGVARRTTYRAAAYGAATGAAYGAAAGSGCVQAVDAYGRIYTRCY
jgi:hypothetical protein